ncbi:transporter substrate-binding domain-containing protein [Saccharopolyspora indica]|uniref:transporter substrate-binding domain-containing protein n=1 Tax=Saccharopolyspora indica TaxID=1229659 RepID=UPI0022EAD99C|nr:transporter substrate-binding domain-containing protein [Saccharopolyspora indica]MDA3649648.1 transporter substrate-binding domain-containing protein [Saccharopolyspora indica]
MMRIRVLALVSLTAVLAACGQNPEVSQNLLPPLPPAPATSAAPPVPSAGTSVELSTSPTLVRVQQRRKLLAGVSIDTPPAYVSRDPAGGGYQGFDVEIARELAQRIGLRPEDVQFRRLPPTQLRSAVLSGDVDLLLGGTADIPSLTAVGPYAITDSERNLVIKADDRLLAGELQRMLDAAVADGSWQRAYEKTLGAAGIEARPGS